MVYHFSSRVRFTSDWNQLKLSKELKLMWETFNKGATRESCTDGAGGGELERCPASTGDQEPLEALPPKKVGAVSCGSQRQVSSPMALGQYYNLTYPHTHN